MRLFLTIACLILLASPAWADTTIATDNFNRSDDPSLGANWTEMRSGATFDLVTNSARPGNLGFDCHAFWNADSFPDDQYAQAAITVTGTTSQTGPGVVVRASGLDGTRNFYAVHVDHAASNNVEISKRVAGTFTHLAYFTTTWVDGDVVKLSAVGTTIAVYQNGSLLGSTTDASVSSGSAGVTYSSTATAAIIDNWEGGSVSSGPAIVQHVINEGTGSSQTVAVTLTSTTAGTLLVVGCTSSDESIDGVVASVTDGGDTFTHPSTAQGISASGFLSDLWYVLSGAGGKTTATCTFTNTASTTKAIEAWEVSGFTTPIFYYANSHTATAVSGEMDGPSLTKAGVSSFLPAIVFGGTIDENPKSGNEFTDGGDVSSSTQTGAVSLLSSGSGGSTAAWHETGGSSEYVSSGASFCESGGACAVATPVSHGLLLLMGVGQ